VKRACHDAIGRVEGFFDAVPVVNVGVDVEHSLVFSVGDVGSAAVALCAERRRAHLRSSRIPNTLTSQAESWSARLAHRARPNLAITHISLT
jgi:hypothetical protein